MTYHVKVMPIQLIRYSQHILHVIQRMVVHAFCTVIGIAVTRKVERNQVELRQQWRQPIEGVGVIQPAMQTKGGRSFGITPLPGTDLQTQDIKLKGFA